MWLVQSAFGLGFFRILQLLYSTNRCKHPGGLHIGECNRAWSSAGLQCIFQFNQRWKLFCTSIFFQFTSEVVRNNPPLPLDHALLPVLNPAHEKMYFSRQESQISYYFLCISLSQKSKFPSKWINFPAMTLPKCPFFPTMLEPWSNWSQHKTNGVNWWRHFLVHPGAHLLFTSDWVRLLNSIQIIDCSWVEWWKIIVPEVNSTCRQRLNFTKGTIIFYHFPNKRAVNICFIHPIHRFLVCTEP